MECWKFVTLRPTYLLIIIYCSTQASLSLCTNLLQLISVANSVPKDLFLACLCFTAASKYEAFTMRNDSVSNVQFFTASYTPASANLKVNHKTSKSIVKAYIQHTQPHNI